MFSFSTKQYHVSREANLESFVAARVTSLKPRILWVLQTLVSYVIWPLVAGTAPTASSLDAVILLDLWVCAGMCCWDLWLLPWSWPARLQTLPSCGPHCVSLLLVASQHICIHHWDKPKLLSLVHAMLLPQGWNGILSKAHSLLKHIMLPFPWCAPKFQRITSPKLWDFFVLRPPSLCYPSLGCWGIWIPS